MPKSIHVILFSALWLSACATTSHRHESDHLKIQLDAANTKLENLETALAKRIVKSCGQDKSKLVADISKAVAVRLREPDKKKTKVKVVKCVDEGETTRVDGKLVFGAVEHVQLVKEKRNMKARIDTGALSSSMGVYRPLKFERDGKRWVKFSLDQADGSQVYEYPVSGSINIKQESDEASEYRYEIKTDVLVGGNRYRNQTFNLADRSHLDYQLLIGRNFLRDIAVVDVSDSFLQGKK